MNAPSCNWQPVERQRTIYRHLETDEEFRDRLRRAGHVYITAHPAYRRKDETFNEYRLRTRYAGEADWEWFSRIGKTYSYMIRNLSGEDLDDKVWYALKIQRRIVEVA